MMKSIDAHLHIFEHLTGFGFMGEFRALGGGKARWALGGMETLFPEDFGDTGVSAERMLRFMDDNDIEKAILLQGSAYGFQNEYVAESVAKYPERLVGTATIDPFIYYFDQVLDRLTGELQFTRFKLEMSVFGGLCGYHDPDALWNHPNLDKLCRRLNDMKGTLALDIGGPDTASHRVRDVRRFALKYPNLNIVICHLLSMPGDRAADLTAELSMLNMDNVWFDLAAIASNTKEHEPFSWARTYLRIARETVGAKKLLWGTDCATVLKDYSYGELQRIVTDSDLFTAQELEMIFMKNAIAAYRI